MTTLGVTLPTPVKTYLETLKCELKWDIAMSDYYLLFWSMAQQFRLIREAIPFKSRSFSEDQRQNDSRKL